MGALAQACALLQLPRMPELAHRSDLDAFQPSPVAAASVQVHIFMMPSPHLS